jgi:hypothetical protein
MPAHYVIDSANRIVLSIFRGVLTLRDITEQRDRLQNDHAFDPELSELIDFDSVSEVQMDYADFKSLLEVDPFSTKSKRAFVIGSPNSVSGTAQMFQVLRSDDICVKIFKTVSEAAGWLGSTDSVN